MTGWKLEDLSEPARVERALVARQLGRPSARRKAHWLGQCASHLRDAGVAPERQVTVCVVPGRIEFLGKHTDYAGGRSLVAATQQGLCLVAVASKSSHVRITDLMAHESVEFPWATDLQPTAGHWSNYSMTVIRRVRRNFPSATQAVEMAFASDLPQAAGLSSSSVLIVATFLAVAAANRLDQVPEYARHILAPQDLAGYLGTVENGQSFGQLRGDAGVGTFGGSEDHTAILCAQPGRLSQYAYCPVRFERSVRLPEDHVFAIASSGVKAEKTGSAMERYNRISQLAAAVTQVWRQTAGRDDPHMAAALASSPGAVDQMRRALSVARHAEFSAEQLLDRFDQFFSENEQIIPAVADDLGRDAAGELGRLVDRSQALAERCLGNQVPETVFLADSARRMGAMAASAFGAGFGGSVWALTSTQEAPELIQKWNDLYRQEFPQHADQATFFSTAAGPGALCLSDER